MTPPDNDPGHYPKITVEEPAPGTPAPSVDADVLSEDRPDLGTSTVSTEPSEVVVSLRRRDLEVLTVAPIVPGRDGMVRFRIGSSMIEISGAGDMTAFTYRRDAAHILRSTTTQLEFGVVAGEIASIAEKPKKQERKTGLFGGLDIAVRPGAEEIVATPDKSLLAGGMRPEWCLLGGADPAEDTNLFDAGKLARWPLSCHPAPPPPIATLEDREDLGQLSPAALARALSAMKDLIATGGERRDLETIELRNGVLYGGSDAALWCIAPSLQGADLWLARNQLPSLVKLLALLPPGPAQVARDQKFHIITSADFEIYLTIPKDRHPGRTSPALEKLSGAVAVVDAGQLRSAEADLRRGRGKKYPNAWLNVRLVASDQPRLKMQSYRPADGRHNVSAGDLVLDTAARGLGFDLLIPLAIIRTALVHFEQNVRLQASEKHFFISGPVKDAPWMELTVKVAAAPVPSRARLAWQVRHLRHPAVNGR
jgi:hypothetical protein